MLHAGRLSETSADAAVYAGHSEGLTRLPLVDRAAGSVHQDLAVVEIAPGGGVDLHLHAFEQAFYVLEGSLELQARDSTEALVADDYVFVERGAAHGLRNPGDRPARLLEVSAPQPGALALADTVFPTGAVPRLDVEQPIRKGHFDLGDLPEPTGTLGLAGFEGANVGGASVKILVGPDFGASQLVLMMLRYVPGGFIAVHDHAFEEAFLILEGEIEAELEGEPRTFRAGDYFWSGVGSTHALVNRSDAPVRWLETQAPQPPARHQARFTADWERFLGER